ncbi:MAG: DMT family transporter [Anaerolineales bacterium]|nr:DMT family transporter [Anaerolineales bacterium]
MKNTLTQLNTSKLSGILLVITATACWGTSGIFIHNIIQKSGLSAVGLAFWRDLISSVVMLTGILITRPKLLIVKKKDLPWLIGMGVISIGAFHVFWNNSVLMLGASLATVIQCNAPIFVTIMARLLFKEQLTIQKIIAIGLAVAGTILVAGLINEGNWSITARGLWIALSSAITYGSLSLFGKKLSTEYNSWTIMFYIFSIGTLSLFLFQSGKPDPWPTGSGILGWVLGFVLISTILGFGLYTKALSILPASTASITATAEILFASVLAYFILGEQLGIWQILGALLIISGVVLVSLSRDNFTDSMLSN